MNLTEMITEIENHIQDVHAGLPEEIFLLISRITPLVNVDLFIRNDRDETLLTWRDDEQCGTGWHIPGGIVRFQETIGSRIHKVAKRELGVEVFFDEPAVAMHEVIKPFQKNRGHFISFLYSCALLEPLPIDLQYYQGIPKIGQWAWHARCPSNILSIHRIYTQFIDADRTRYENRA